jgi:hypothetical protein
VLGRRDGTGLVAAIGLGLGVLGLWQQAGAVVAYRWNRGRVLRSWMVVASRAVTFALLVPVLLVGALIYLGHHGDVNCDAGPTACGINLHPLPRRRRPRANGGRFDPGGD